MEQSTLDRLKALIGYESVYCDGQPVEEGMIRRFAEAIGDPNPLYRDREFATRSPFGGIVTPPTFVFEWDHHEAFRVDESGVYIGDTPLPQRLVRAGNRYEFGVPLRPGDIVTTRSRIADVYGKQGASGEMVFIICRSIYLNQRGEILGRSASINIVWS